MSVNRSFMRDIEFLPLVCLTCLIRWWVVTPTTTPRRVFRLSSFLPPEYGGDGHLIDHLEMDRTSLRDFQRRHLLHLDRGMCVPCIRRCKLLGTVFDCPCISLLSKPFLLMNRTIQVEGSVGKSCSKISQISCRTPVHPYQHPQQG